MENLFENQDIVDINIEDSVKASYLDYSMSVIIGRALPDAKDGLKPVHRRILYAMHDLNLTSKVAYKKSARIVGDVIGKYHPHGDTSVYDALVRMAQSFSMRAPLVDGQGNFGSVDGDSAAAMRYTEARMTRIAEEVLRDLDKDTVNFVPNYDDTMKEPAVLPTRVPTLLLNGSEGIAVGMATKIPPHNLGELLDAILHLIDNPSAEAIDLMEFIQGPDFPTGGTIFGRRGIVDAYNTGRGRVRIRAKHHIESKAKKDVIVIDELPYQVNKARLIELIANLAKDKQIDGIAEVRDESDREGIRVVIELKKEAMAEIVLNNLYKSTPMETTFGIILLAVYNKEPKVFNLPEILNIFLSHRKTVIIRRTIFDLEKAKARAHILEGLKIALDNIDEVVKIIRASANDTEAKDNLSSRFGLSAIQSQAILDMRLGRLTGLQRDKLEAEYAELMLLIAELESILRSEEKLNEIIKEELNEIKEKFSTPRKTEIEDSYDEIDVEDLIPNEPMVVTITHNGYVKRVPIKSYERQKRGGKGKVAVTTHDDDFIERFFVSNTHDTLMFVTNMGQLYWLKVYKIPEGSRTAKGKAVVNLINLRPDEKIMAIIPTPDFDESKSLVFFTRNGIIKRTSLNEFSNIRSNGVRAIVLDDADEIVTAKIADVQTQYIMIFTSLGQCIRFELEKTRDQGRSTRGVRGIKFKIDTDIVVDADVIDSEEQEILTVSEKGIGKRTTIEEYRLTNRAGSGVIAMKLSPKTGNIVGEVLVDDTQDLMLLTSIGKMIRVDMQTIRKAGRNTSGVIIVNMDKDDKVVSIAKCPKEDEEIELDENGNIIRYNEDGEVIETSKDEEENLLDIIDNKEEE
ncbi:DNA gyrase subunit A [Aliarcobacter cryaerophilus]|uniref:DNA gyrase subunit A n=1 Tax=Aliarcobacter cryaerophilus TaxID=28198 RepID=UPI0008252828|nr:DNA gyrase subunit A [Aliarcobacter cryaerophilus]OQA74809.1 MAG: DNA gyrase subunit A [Candidatus Dependentiae bacterium ADurb.Bin246]MCT7463293.1 DNA gyrase subunit A [Aliarcobacter cryaerophilus]MCT7487205.1 DNA gyrase subunit A [Aliarcobacter cryaerophilus]MCT7488921.1 DNA gyrase subunit A [Aliarcobacter cryaerophilus]MCT7491701.1 DNA gyrase subunit A [Aliarcobacter cryaerophilus]